MPHLIDAQPVYDTTQKIAALIPDSPMRARFAALLSSAFLSEDACARPIHWKEALERKLESWRDPTKPILVFDPPRARINLARRHARAVRDALLEIEYITSMKAPLSPRDTALARCGDEWLKKQQRMNYEAFMERAFVLLAERRTRLRAERDAQPVYPEHEIQASRGRVWRRIVSIAQMRRAGMDLHNCLAGASGERHGYARRFREDISRFWALYDETGVARAALMTDALTGRVCEARSFRNAPYPLEGADFDALVAAGVAHAPEPAPARPPVEALTSLAWPVRDPTIEMARQALTLNMRRRPRTS